MFEVPTLEEVLQLVQGVNRNRRKPVGVYPETKHPSYFQGLGLAMERPLVKLLHEYGSAASARP